MKISVAQYELEQLSGWETYEDKLVRLVERAKEDADSDLLALSEMAGLEIGGWVKTDPKDQFRALQKNLPQYQELFLSLAKTYQLYIQPGTVPVLEEDGFYRNRAYLFSPTGQIAYQDKIFLTPYERQLKLFRPGTGLTVFETTFGKLGITISYDSEFPALANHLVKSGVNLILVPSYTEKISGLTRVMIECRARAIENQCFVAHACLFGKSSWADFIDISTAQSGIYCPAESGFSEDGILAQAQLNTPMLLHAELNWDKLKQVREHGEMSNFHDMQTNITTILSDIKTVTTD